MVKHYVDDFWEKTRHLQKQALDRLSRNEISPVAYYMLLRGLAPAEVAARAGLSAGRVTKHMKPRFFETMRLATALKYAEIFGITPADLFQINRQENQEQERLETSNPFVAIYGECAEDNR